MVGDPCSSCGSCGSCGSQGGLGGEHQRKGGQHAHSRDFLQQSKKIERFVPIVIAQTHQQNAQHADFSAFVYSSLDSLSFTLIFIILRLSVSELHNRNDVRNVLQDLTHNFAVEIDD